MTTVSAIVLPQLIAITKELTGDEKRFCSSSVPDSHVEPFETAKQVTKKIGSSFCEPGNPLSNVALDISEKLLFKLSNGQRKHNSK